MISLLAAGCHDISFPGLGIYLKNVPQYFEIGNLQVYWYAVCIAVGFTLAFFYATGRSEKFGVKSDDLLDLLFFAVPLGILGARIYYVLFELDLYRDNPISILYIWEGGLAIYGGLIGGLLTALIFCKVKKIPVPALFDITAVPFLIAQGIGRWGNFFNAEAYGVETALPWRMVINDTIVAHPTFLYESVWCLLGALLLHLYSKHRKFDGEVFLLYVAWYSLERSVVEMLRTDSLYFWGTDIRVSQLFSLILFFVCVGVLIYNYGLRKTPFYLLVRDGVKEMEKPEEAEQDWLEEALDTEQAKQAEQDLIDGDIEDGTVFEVPRIEPDENAPMITPFAEIKRSEDDAEEDLVFDADEENKGE